MLERRKQELDLVEAKYGELERGPNLDWFIIKRWPLSAAWSKSQTAVLVLIPPGYAATPPDNFQTDADLRLAGDREPGNASGFMDCEGRRWRVFSYHVESADWQPDADLTRGHNILTFLDGVRSRLSEAD